jgi:2-oxoglutarate ferredoxin oxidoreductase subunit alpha
MGVIYGKGAEIIGESLVQLGVRSAYGIPYPPISELHEYLAKKGIFRPAVSIREMAALSLGLALGGERTCMVTAGTGIYDCMESISYAVSYEVPLTIVHVGKSIPGFGNPYPYQGDLDVLRGGDFPPVVFSPASVEEIPLLMAKMVETGERFSVPAVFYVDSALFNMTGNVEVSVDSPKAEFGFRKNDKRYYTSVYLDVTAMKKQTASLIGKYKKIDGEALCEPYMMEDAEYAICAYGISAYVAKKVADDLRLSEKKIGVLRPLTLSPFCSIREEMKKVKKVFVVEMSNMQLFRFVRGQLDPKVKVESYATHGGLLPERNDVIQFIKGLI